MGAQSDQVKGHAKETAGLLTGNDKLRAEGRADRLAGEAKEKVDQAKNLLVDALQKGQDGINSALNKAKKALRDK